MTSLGDLSLPKEVVADDQSASLELRQHRIEIVAVLGLHAIDEEEIERAFEPGQNVECGPFVKHDPARQ